MESNHILPLDSSSAGAGELNLNQTWLVDRMMDQTDHTLLKVTWIMEGIVLVGIGGLSVIGKVYQFALTLTGMVNPLVLRQCGVCWPPGCPPLLAAAEALVPDVGGAALRPGHSHCAAHRLDVQCTLTLPNHEGSGSNVKVKCSLKRTFLP